MAYRTLIKLSSLQDNDSYPNKSGKYECPALVQQLTGAPEVKAWNRGTRVMDAPEGSIPSGTAIATFDENGKYPLTERHTAIYVSHNANGITVYDQWVGQDKSKLRIIRLKNHDHRDINDAKYYWIVNLLQ